MSATAPAKKTAARKAPARKPNADLAALIERVAVLERVVGQLAGAIVAAELQRQLTGNPQAAQQLLAQMGAQQS